MKITELTVDNFRNYDHLALTFDENINVFLGQNAQGKTNLLEAIYFLALTRSHRTQKDQELIKFGEDYATVSATVQKSQFDLNLAIKLSKHGKIALLNQLEQAKLSNYIGKMTAILFSPEDLSLVKGAPATRRKFLDLEFGQMNFQYLTYLSQYKKVLKQRNNYLKQLQLKRASDLVFLEVLSEQLAGFGAEVVKRRLGFLKRLSVLAQAAQSEISGTKEKLEIKYQSTLGDLKSEQSVAEIKELFLQQFQKNNEKEIRQGTTLFGPHRDDLAFFINEQNVQLYGSQGQQRTVVLSLKLAEIELAHELTHEYPILLLDDVLSELDATRQTALLKYIHQKTQTFITTTDLSGISQEIINTPKVFRIKDGMLLPYQEKE